MSVRDGFEVSRELIPDARSGKGEGAFTKLESGWLLDKVIVVTVTLISLFALWLQFFHQNSV